jgi:hypothetical protein
MKLKVNNMRFFLNQVAGDDKVILVGAAPDRKYKDGKTTGVVLGTRYQVVAPAAKYADFSVKVPGIQTVSQEEIDTAKAPLEVTFSNFFGRFYRLDGASDYDFTAQADEIIVGSKGKEKGASV